MAPTFSIPPRPVTAQTLSQDFASRLSASNATSFRDPAFATYLDETCSTREGCPPDLRDRFCIPRKRDVGGVWEVELDEEDEEDGEDEEVQDYRENHWLDSPCVYLCGNSLGLMPFGTKAMIEKECHVWAQKAVLGHFEHPEGRHWKSYADDVAKKLAPILGADKTSEVAVMGSLTSNLHTLMCAFYRPTQKRYKILFEAKAFPSDAYAFESQARLHGLDPSKALLKISPRPGEFALRTSDIVDMIKKEGDEIAVVLFSGVQFYTGQLFEIEKITKAGHEKGCLVGWDLAHAVGNVPLLLHDWKVDFATFCTYKYLNAGPGSISGIFVHQMHEDPKGRFRLQGWWGHNAAIRFEMGENFDPIPGAPGFQLSNPDIFSLASLSSSLDVFHAVAIEAPNNSQGGVTSRDPYEKGRIMRTLRKRSEELSWFLETLIKTLPFYVEADKVGDWIREWEESEEARVKKRDRGFEQMRGKWGKGKVGGDGSGSGKERKDDDDDDKPPKVAFTIITPSQMNQRGCQTSILFLPSSVHAFSKAPHQTQDINVMRLVHAELLRRGIVADERDPDVIRFAPVPLYNSFTDVAYAAHGLYAAMKDVQESMWETRRVGKIRGLEGLLGSLVRQFGGGDGVPTGEDGGSDPTSR